MDEQRRTGLPGTAAWIGWRLREDGPRALLARGVHKTAGLLRATAGHVGDVFRYGSVAPGIGDVVWVDPAEIEYVLVPSLLDLYPVSRLVPVVLDGDWDRAPIDDGQWFTNDAEPPPVRRPLSEYALQQAIRRHFTEDVPWEETEWYRWIASQNGALEAGRIYADVETMDRYLDRLDRLYHDIEADGYRSQTELHGSGIGRTLHEITVAIGRDGRFIKSIGGRHRLAVATVLDVEAVPVRVWARHERWQRARSAATRGDRESAVALTGRSWEDLRSHPDIPCRQEEAE